MSLLSRLDRIETKRRAVLALARAMPPAEVTARPGESWSVRDVIEHLVLAEEYVFVDLTRLDALEDRSRGLRQRQLYLLVMFVFRFRVPVKTPTPKIDPTGGRSLDDLAVAWEENHRRLRRFLAGLDRAGTRRAIFRHPVSGPITVTQALRMLEIHLDRHTRQIREIEGLVRTPAGVPA